MFISIIVPCFNEELVIRSNLIEISEYLQTNFPQINFEVIAVNDGSLDNTLKILNQLRNEISVLKVEDLVVNQGRGAAMKRGIASAKGQYMMFLDADLSYDVEHIGEVINKFKINPEVDAIIISPYMKGGIAKNIPPSRLFLSKTANWILSGFFSRKISTVTSMVRAYKTSVIKNLPLYEDGKELHLEILRKLNLIGANIIEVPGKLIWKEKKSRNKRMNKKKVASSAGKHLLYGFLAKPTRFLGKISIFILLIGFYETFNVIRVFIKKFQFSPEGFWRDVWYALNETFNSSPHTVVISAICLIVGLQMLSFLALFTVLQMQHEESLKHILMILKKDK